ncbi:CBS domain-containing protein, partial [Arthrospira platensis SPKY1]|nr:CBS domain-containing protein [Arthrospira platensis SPKY1]
MTPRSEIVSINLLKPESEILEKVLESEHSVFPVCQGGLDHLLGIIPTKRLLKQVLKSEPISSIHQHLLPAVYVPETLTGMKLLEQFRESGVQMVFVVDEYGEIVGI